MFRGTTPKLEFIFDYNLEDLNIEEFYITIKQGSKLISEKSLKDITISKNKAIISLTQSETLSMRETYNVLMQARLKVNGEAYATDIVSVGVAAILKDGVIPGGSVDPDTPDKPGCDCGTIDYNDLENKPTKLSDFINDGVFITNTVNDLINYYTKEEINNLVTTIPKFSISVVNELPTENISSTTIYLVPSNSSANDIYKEYIYVNNNWELLGIQKIDLTDYYNKTEINTLLSSKVNIYNLYTNLNGTFSTITLSDSISNYDAIGIYYFWESSSSDGTNYIQVLPSFNNLTLNWITPPLDGNGIQFASYKITISGNTITFYSYSLYRNVYITATSATMEENQFIGNYILHTPYITKVVGYKY